MTGTPTKPLTKTVSKKVSDKTNKESRVRPVTFALDEKTNQGLVVFETLKEKVKFSVYLSDSLDLALFLQESFKRRESGFVLSKKIIESQGLKIKKARITNLEGDRELVHLFFKLSKKVDSKKPDEQKPKIQKMEVSLLEILGLWTLENFSLYACNDFIEKCRDVKIELKETKNPLGADLHKRYGQKYLM